MLERVTGFFMGGRMCLKGILTNEKEPAKDRFFLML